MTIDTQLLEFRLGQLLPGTPQTGAAARDLHAELLRTLRRLETLDAQRAELDEIQTAGFEDDLARVYRRAARLAAAMPGEPTTDAVQAVLRIGSLLGRSLDQAMVREVAHQVATRPVFAPPFSAQRGAALVDAVFAAIALAAARSEPPAAGVAA